MLKTHLVTCSRTILGRPFQFSDGLTLPAGARFGFPTKALQSDPEKFSNALEFDGFRFARADPLENGSSEISRRWGAASMGTTNLA